MENSRSELRKIIMTILYQTIVYDKNKMNYELDNVINIVDPTYSSSV